VEEPLEGLVSSIRAVTGDPMIIALNTSADPTAILSSLRAGINEYLYRRCGIRCAKRSSGARRSAAGGAAVD